MARKGPTKYGAVRIVVPPVPRFYPTTCRLFRPLSVYLNGSRGMAGSQELAKTLDLQGTKKRCMV
jgi:hypothetical protein